MKTLFISVRFTNNHQVKDLLNEVHNHVMMGHREATEERFDYVLEDEETPRSVRPKFQIINKKMCIVYQSKMNFE